MRAHLRARTFSDAQITSTQPQLDPHAQERPTSCTRAARLRAAKGASAERVDFSCETREGGARGDAAARSGDAASPRDAASPLRAAGEQRCVASPPAWRPC